MKWTLGREKLLSHVGCANIRVTIATLVRIGIKFNERCDVTEFLYVVFFFLFIALIIAFMTMILVSQCFLLIIIVSLCYHYRYGIQRAS